MKYHAKRHQGEPLHQEQFCTETGEWTYDDVAEHDAALAAFLRSRGSINLAAFDDWMESQEWSAVAFEGVTRKRAEILRYIVAGNDDAAHEAIWVLQMAPPAHSGVAYSKSQSGIASKPRGETRLTEAQGRRAVDMYDRVVRENGKFKARETVAGEFNITVDQLDGWRRRLRPKK